MDMRSVIIMMFAICACCSSAEPCFYNMTANATVPAVLHCGSPNTIYIKNVFIGNSFSCPLEQLGRQHPFFEYLSNQTENNRHFSISSYQLLFISHQFFEPCGQLNSKIRDKLELDYCCIDTESNTTGVSSVFGESSAAGESSATGRTAFPLEEMNIAVVYLNLVCIPLMLFILIIMLASLCSVQKRIHRMEKEKDNLIYAYPTFGPSTLNQDGKPGSINREVTYGIYVINPRLCPPEKKPTWYENLSEGTLHVSSTLKENPGETTNVYENRAGETPKEDLK